MFGLFFAERVLEKRIVIDLLISLKIDLLIGLLKGLLIR